MFNIHFIASGSEGNACFVSDGETGVLIDCGVSSSILRKYMNLGDIDLILITHEHQDHSRGAVKLADRLQIPVATGSKTHRKLSAGLPGYLKKKLKAFKKYSFKTLKILPFDVSHDAVEPMGFLIGNKHGESIAFIPDTGIIPDYKLNADVFVIEANYEWDLIREAYDAGNMSDIQYFRLIADDGHMDFDDSLNYIRSNVPEKSTVFLHHIGNIKNWEKLDSMSSHDIKIVYRGYPNYKYSFGFKPELAPF